MQGLGLSTVAVAVWAAALGGPGVSVTSVAPANNAVDVPLGTNVTLTFSSPLAPASVTVDSVLLTQVGGPLVPATVGLAPSGTIVTLSPVAPLAVSSAFRVDVTADVLDGTGAPVAPFTSFFLTESRPGSGVLLSDVGEQVETPTLSARSCLEQVAGFPISCTGADVQVGTVFDVNVLDDGCRFPGDTITLTFRVELLIRPKRRFDIGVYFSAGASEAAEGIDVGPSCRAETVPFEGFFDVSHECIGDQDPFSCCTGAGQGCSGSYLDLDNKCKNGTCELHPASSCVIDSDCPKFDLCGDMDDTVFLDITDPFELLCVDADVDGFLDMSVCTSWRRQGANELCFDGLDAFPGNPTSCNCRDVPVAIPFGGFSVAEGGAMVTVGNNLGFSVASTGDLDGDGLEDFLAGAPGLRVAGETEAGAAALYLGSTSRAQRGRPDVIFLGGTAHGRAGGAVAGGFDFDGDGVNDLLIGAEEVDRTRDPPVAVGAGRTYLVYFDPLDYDRNGTGVPDYGPGTCSLDPGRACRGTGDCGGAGPCSEPGPPVLMQLASIGTQIRGAVFTGVKVGDQAGFSVAAGPGLNPGPGADLVIGAPGAGRGDGRVYVIFDNPALSGTHGLRDVAGALPGHVLTGAGAERLGSAVALPGDLVDPPGEDLAIGAPNADPGGLAAAGIVYLVPGGALASDTLPASTAPVRIVGDQAHAELGFSVAAGGDNRADGDPDLLIGAPFHDADGGLAVDAGRVLHTSGRLGPGVIPAAAVGDGSHPSPVPGVVWEGAASQDRLGWAARRVGDVTGNGLEDVSLGAPFASNGGTAAGVVYLIEGAAGEGLGGTVDVSLVGPAISGTVFLGTQANERAGVVLSGAGDLSGDESNDFTVGAPGFAACSMSGAACLFDSDCGSGETCTAEAGTVHLVLDPRPDVPGRCGTAGCRVVDLATGAQLIVEASALAGTVDLAVRGLIDPATHPGAACERDSVSGRSIAGLADFDDENRTFPAGLEPAIDVPTLGPVEYQLNPGEELELRYCDPVFGWIPVGTGVVADNAYVPGRLAVTAGVDTLHMYAAFVDDGDRDGTRTSCDCDDLDPEVWAVPGAVGTLHLAHDPSVPAVAVLTWGAPAFAGGVQTLYDTVRSGVPGDFVAVADCVESGDAEDTTSVDPLAPNEGGIFYYVVHAHNACLNDPGCSSPPPAPRTVRSCP